MSQIVYRGNLSAAAFPFISENTGRSVIVQGQDNTFVPQITSKEDLDQDRGIPQVYYCHNVITTGQGFKSIAYSERIASIGVSTFRDVIRVRDASNPDAQLGYTSNGDFYVAASGATTWTFLANLGGVNPIVTTAYVNGVTYIYVGGIGCWKYDFGLSILVPVVLTGLVAGSILGITGVQGYLIAWSINAIAWSSTIDPTDFVPSLITGAGGGAVEGARGPIVCCAAIQLGFIVYTNTNAVSAIASGNARYPFNFKEIVNSGGITTLDLVSWDANTGNHISYTASGLQSISPYQTQVFLPEVTDFISGKYFEDFDEATLTFSQEFLTTPMVKRLQVVSDQYLIISYGKTSYTHALIYNLSTKRFSKFKVTHVACIEYPPIYVNAEAPRESIGFVKSTGQVVVADLSTQLNPGTGVLLLGKFQYVRARTLTLEKIDLENVRPWADLAVYDLLAVDGKNTTNRQLTEIVRAGLLRTYGTRLTGLNHSLLLVGAFDMVTYLLTFHVNGYR